MSQINLSNTHQEMPDTEIWNSLKQAIASSSGFQRWLVESPDVQSLNLGLDRQVQRYLRETLENLAY